MTPRKFVEAPQVTPLPFGLLSAAIVLDDLDGHGEFGVEYEPEHCGPAYVTEGVCAPPRDLGSISVAVNNARQATLTVTGAPDGDYTIDWGDGTTVTDSTPSGATHTYASDGNRLVLLTGDDGYVAKVPIGVTNGSTSGPFTATASAVKVPTDGIGVVEGVPFVVYHLVRCRLVGGVDRMAERARRSLQLGEGRAVESVLAQQLATTEGAVDLTPTPGTAVHPVEGLALLEEWAAANYGGVATIHAPRGIGTILATHGATERVGVTRQTGQGSLVAAGAGYSDLEGPLTDASDPTTTQPAGTGEAWLYVTGQVVVRRGSTIEVGPQIGTSPANNEGIALAERPYVVTTECITAAVLVSRSYEVPA